MRPDELPFADGSHDSPRSMRSDRRGSHGVPQPHPSRLTPVLGHPAVVGIEPGQPELVALTAISLAQATGSTLYFAYVDPGRYPVVEHPDGTVDHALVDPDLGDDGWHERQADLEAYLHALVDPTGVPWHFRYLAGRVDRALTHLARAVDAAVLVVGTREPGLRGGLREFVDGSVAVQLAHHQHRPVLTVPLQVVDWKARLA